MLADTTDLSGLREDLREEIGDLGQPADLKFALADPVERVLLTATELAGNAIRHAGPPVILRLLRSGGGWMVKVTDDRPDAHPRQAERDASGQGKRGLLIVDALSAETGWCRDEDVKHVWAFVPDQPPPRLVLTLRPDSYG